MLKAHATALAAVLTIPILAASILVASTLVAPWDGARADELCGRSFETLAGLVGDVIADGGEMTQDDERTLTIADEGRLTVWTLFKVGTPTPGMLCRRPRGGDGATRVEVGLLCRGEPDACAALERAYEEASPAGR